ncbi:MAG: hypothetical protein L3J82_08730 [Planctomycetes bacterium]|nr:hypothetical protein [Planctomycetota bacterium]
MSATYEQIDIEVLTEEQQKMLLSRLVQALSLGACKISELLGSDNCPELPEGTEEVLAKNLADYKKAGIVGRTWEEVRDSIGNSS